MLQRHCEEVYTDQKETREVQDKRIEYFRKKGDQRFTVDGRRAEITVDLVLQVWAKMSDNRVSGPEDTVVSEMMKLLPVEKFYTFTKCFQRSASCSKLAEDCETRNQKMELEDTERQRSQV